MSICSCFVFGSVRAVQQLFVWMSFHFNHIKRFRQFHCSKPNHTYSNSTFPSSATLAECAYVMRRRMLDSHFHQKQASRAVLTASAQRICLPGLPASCISNNATSRSLRTLFNLQFKSFWPSLFSEPLGQVSFEEQPIGDFPHNVLCTFEHARPLDPCSRFLYDMNVNW